MQVIASTPFLGALVAPELVRPTLIALEAIPEDLRINHIEIAFPAWLDQSSLAADLGYSVEVCETVVVPLAGRSADQVWRSVSNSCRRAVRKAEAEGVEIVEAPDGSFVRDYYPMCREVYRRTGRSPHLSREFYTAAWDALAAQGPLKAVLAMRAGKTIAGGVFLMYRDTLYYLSGASYDDALPSRPNNLVQWYMITWALANGYGMYDMGGATVDGITHFKLSFGGRRLPFTRLYRANTASARVGRALYQKGIPIWRRLSTWAGI